MQSKNLNHTELFGFYNLNEDGMKKAISITLSFDSILDFLEKVCPNNREFSIAKTKLEEACFFARKSMANDLQNHEPVKTNVPDNEKN